MAVENSVHAIRTKNTQIEIQGVPLILVALGASWGRSDRSPPYPSHYESPLRSF